MSKFRCSYCGAPTDNDQSFIMTGIPDVPPRQYDVHRCDKCDKRFHQELDWESAGETINEKKIICPYCEHEYDDYDAYDFDEGNHPEVECESCGRMFDLEIREIRTYSTKRSLSEMPENYGEEDEA